jgi:hypothetical protein
MCKMTKMTKTSVLGITEYHRGEYWGGYKPCMSLKFSVPDWPSISSPWMIIILLSAKIYKESDKKRNGKAIF